MDRERVIQRLKILLSKEVLADNFREAVEDAILLLINDGGGEADG